MKKKRGEFARRAKEPRANGEQAGDVPAGVEVQPATEQELAASEAGVETITEATRVRSPIGEFMARQPDENLQQYIQRLSRGLFMIASILLFSLIVISYLVAVFAYHDSAEKVKPIRDILVYLTPVFGTYWGVVIGRTL